MNRISTDSTLPGSPMTLTGLTKDRNGKLSKFIWMAGRWFLNTPEKQKRAHPPTTATKNILGRVTLKATLATNRKRCEYRVSPLPARTEAFYCRHTSHFLTETPLPSPLLPQPPNSPPSVPTQWLFLGPPAASKLSAVIRRELRSLKMTSRTV